MDNSIMKLTVTTDDKIGKNSKTFVLNFPFKEKLPNALFDIGLVTDVDGYKNLEVLVVKQEGFEGKLLVGKKLTYQDLSVWDENVNELTHWDDNERFRIEAYLRFYGNECFWTATEHCNDISIIKCDDKNGLREYLKQTFASLYDIKTDWQFQINNYLNWDKILATFLEDGLGMIYKDHYVFLQPWCLDSDFDPQPRRLARTLRDWIKEGEYPMSLNKSLLGALPDIRFSTLLEMLNNGEPLAPVFLDNDIRYEIFYALACAVGTDTPSELMNGYEKIWVKPVNNN